MRFVEVILPLPVPGTFTYKLPEDKTPPPNLVGCRVIVQFGKRKIYTGIICKEHDQAPNGPYRPKEVLDLVDDQPVATLAQLHFFQWISSYYMCTLGEVINAALPAALKMSSESYIAVNPETDLDEIDLSEKEHTILNHLQSGNLKLNDVADLLDLKSAYPYIKSLREQEVIQVFEQVKDKYSPKTETRIRLAPEYLKEETLDELLVTLEKKKKQIDVLVAYLGEVPVLDQPGTNSVGITRKKLLDLNVSDSSVRTLVKNGVLVQWEEIVSRFPEIPEGLSEPSPLSPAQQSAKDSILAQFQQKDTVLLKGITGSGKTELYMSMIYDVLANDGQVLYLLPEIALTTQIIKRLSKVFGDRFGVYHSRYSDNERVEVWQKVLDGTYQFVIGARSAIFLPFSDLSLIIVDEEHESSFKQYEPAPRYHARDAAIYLATLYHAKTLLGTATPALETFHNALEGKYGYVRLDERYGQINLPKVVFANLTRERKQRKLKGNFTSQLLEAIQARLEKKEQVILFQNRRGYAPYLTCHNCGYIPKCPHCDVSLTYHMHQEFLICHYCGYKTGMLSECVQCQSQELRTVSFGTEKIEEELEILLPEARIRRMDLDTTRSKYSYQRIIDDFEAGEIDILVGTQMVSKGLDFDKVTLVGVFDADRMIHFPDFRSHERAYQLIHQVSGRAGRRAISGEVVIQTNDPDQPMLGFVRHHNYEAFYQSEILERENFHYPPFYRLITITLKDAEKATCAQAAQFMAMELRRSLGDMRVIGPVEPIIGRIRNQYLFDITVKIEKQGINLRTLKEFLLNSRNLLQSQRLYKGVRVIFDVDPI